MNGHPTANGSAPPLPTTAAENGHAISTPPQAAGLPGQPPATAPLTPAAFTSAASTEVAPTLGAGAAGTSAAAEVMYRYQDVMEHFLDSQRAVMLAFLGTPEAARAAGNGLAAPRPVRQMSALRQPVQQLLPAPAVVPQPQQVSAPPAPAVVHLPAEPVSVAVPAQPVAPPSPPPAAPPPPPAAASAAAAPAALSEADISRTVLEVVSGRTGYPEDMLSLDADMEADLGIDSIKRVEIAGLVFESLPTPDGFTPELETLTTSKTLREVIGAVVSMLGDSTPALIPALPLHALLIRSRPRTGASAGSSCR